MRSAYGAPIEVTAGDASRHFAQWSERAMAAPILIVRHGRARAVLVSPDHYRELSEVTESTTADQNPSVQTALAMVLDHTAEGFFACDEQLNFTQVNAVFETLIGKAAAQLVGQSVRSAFSNAQAAVLVEQLKAVLLSGEATDVELHDDRRVLAVRAFPYPGGVAALILNRSRELALRRRWARYEAVAHALQAMPEVCSVELNLRGVFARVDSSFSDLVGFSAEELTSFRLAEIVHPKARTAFNQDFERAVQAEVGSFSTVLLAKGEVQHRVTVALSIAKRQGLPEAIMAVIVPQSTHM